MKKNKHDIPFDVFQWSKVTIISLSVVCVLLLLTVIGLGAITAKLYQKKEKTPEPILYQVDKAQNLVVQIERGKLTLQQSALLRSVTMRDYVFNRETINHLDEQDRWKKVKLMSSSSIWKEFSNVMNPEINKESPLLNKDFNRNIEIVFDYPIDSHTYRVEFNITDSIIDDNHKPRRFVAIMNYELSDSYVSYKDKFINLDGIVITKYQIREG
jgi:type IV secretory pathway component VirB8